MFTGEVHNLLGSMDAIEALKELSGNSEAAVIASRASERLDIQTGVVMRPANASARHSFALETVSADISDGGCMLISPAPAVPGDIYWLEFADDHLRLGSLFARCIRCRLVSEDVFEVGIKFLAPVDLQSALARS